MNKGVAAGFYNPIRLLHIALHDLQIKMDESIITIKQIYVAVYNKWKAISVILNDYKFCFRSKSILKNLNILRMYIDAIDKARFLSEPQSIPAMAAGQVEGRLVPYIINEWADYLCPMSIHVTFGRIEIGN